MKNYRSPEKTSLSPTFEYTEEDNEVWRILLTQQLPLVQKMACQEYLEGLEKVDFNPGKIPSIAEMSNKLSKLSGWTMVPVDILVPNRIFFQMLAKRTFPTVRIIRQKDEIDFYTNEAPDVFHEYFGHGPMLANRKFAECVRLFGEYSLSCNDEQLLKLTHIFWVTFEFGVIKNNSGVQIYGAGILPSKQETLKIISNKDIQLQKLDIFLDLNASLQGNISQPIYYYIENLDALYELTQDLLSLLGIEKELKSLQFSSTA